MIGHSKKVAQCDSEISLDVVVRTITDLMKGPPFTNARKAIAVSESRGN